MKTGWLSPTGEFCYCEPFEHLTYARIISGEEDNPDIDLIDKGWVQITISTIGAKEQYIYWNDCHILTYEQKNFLRPYFENNDISVSFESRAAWEHDNDMR